MQSGELPAAWSQGSCLGPRRGSAGSAILILPSWSHRHKASPELTGAGGDKGRVADHSQSPLGEAELCYFRACRARLRWAACLARLPHAPMLHQRRALPRVRSRKSRVQVGPWHALSKVKFSVQTRSANTRASGSSNDPGVRQRRCGHQSRRAAAFLLWRLCLSSRGRPRTTI